MAAEEKGKMPASGLHIFLHKNKKIFASCSRRRHILRVTTQIGALHPLYRCQKTAFPNNGGKPCHSTFRFDGPLKGDFSLLRIPSRTNRRLSKIQKRLYSLSLHFPYAFIVLPFFTFVKKILDGVFGVRLKTQEIHNSIWGTRKTQPVNDNILLSQTPF